MLPMDYREKYFQNTWVIAKAGHSYLDSQSQTYLVRPPKPAQIGYIGSNYRRVVFCLLNPGTPTESPEENRVFELLGQFSAAEDEGEARRLFDLTMPQMERCLTGTENARSTTIYTNFMKKVMDKAGLTLRDIAYMNVFNFATVKDSEGVTDEMLYQSVTRFNKNLLENLKPLAVIFRYQRARDAMPNSVLPRHTAVVTGRFVSNQQIDLAVNTVRTALRLG